MLFHMWSEIRIWYMSSNDCLSPLNWWTNLIYARTSPWATGPNSAIRLKVLWICERIMMSLFATNYSETLTSSWSSKRNTWPSQTNIQTRGVLQWTFLTVQWPWLAGHLNDKYSSPKKRSFPLFIRHVFANSKVNGHAFDLSLVFSDVPCVIVRSDCMRTINLNWACNKLRENVFHV